MAYKQYNNLHSYPIQYQQRPCMNPNCIVDFQMNVAQPPIKAITMQNGAASHLLNMSDRNYIQQEIANRWNNVAPDKAKQIPTSGSYCDFWVVLFRCFIPCVIGLCCLIPYMQYKTKKWNKLAIEWRDLFIQEMQDFIENDLKTRYPNLTFTLIYPVCIYQTMVTLQNNQPINQQSMMESVYCYIRVSNGPLAIGDSYEPHIYSSSDYVPAVPVTPAVIYVVNDDVELVTSEGNQGGNEHKQSLLPQSTNQTQ